MDRIRLLHYYSIVTLSKFGSDKEILCVDIVCRGTVDFQLKKLKAYQLRANCYGLGPLAHAKCLGITNL